MVDKDSFYDIGGSLPPDAASSKTASAPASVVKDTRVTTAPLATKITQGEIKMADVDTNMLTQQHSDIRREAAEHRATIQLEAMKGFDRVNADVLRGTAETVKEGMRGDFTTQKAITDSLAQVSNQVDAFEDVANAAFMTVSRDTADLRAQVIQAIDTVKMSTELNSLKGIIEGQKNTTYLSDKIGNDGEKTRALINDLKYNDLNRGLIERNTALVEAVGDGRYWRHRGYLDQGQNQFAQLQTQLQAFGSQLQETRQGMVNFGTMAGVGQTSSSNNV